MYRKWLGKKDKGICDLSVTYVRVNTVTVTNDEEFVWKSGALVHTNKYMYNMIAKRLWFDTPNRITNALIVKCYRGD